jgi:hypothetical protein
MNNKRITFDINTGASNAVNLVINTGSNFSQTFDVITPSESAFNFTGWTGSSQIAKSVSIGSSMYPVATFTVGFTSVTGGKINLSLGSTETRNLKEGRYVYDLLVGTGSSTFRIMDGNVLVRPGISSAP